jgi:hypothetical protein
VAEDEHVVALRTPRLTVARDKLRGAVATKIARIGDDGTPDRGQNHR